MQPRWRAFPGTVLVEYGSGNSRKTRILLDALAPRCYLPLNIACDELKAVVGALSIERPDLRVAAVGADFTRPIILPPVRGLDGLRRVVYFPGSTIGNLSPAESQDLFAQSRRLAGA
jgi:L-histidine N-alpha-methyltransferase